jgi:hypothetical protein
MLLTSGTTQSFESAMAVYTKGAFSKPVATVTLTTALTSAVPAGTLITGLSADGTEIVGKAFDNYSSGANVIRIQYKTDDIQAKYVGCQVGANPKPNIVGCFAGNGTLSIPSEGSVSYKYDPLIDNGNERTIQGFSTKAEEKMYRCKSCPYKTYEKFYDYCT